jgi:wobble nucleotide-excising tRNase
MPSDEQRIAKHEAAITKLEAQLAKLSEKEKEGVWHTMKRQHVKKHDDLTASQKKMNELERKIRIHRDKISELRGESGGRRTRRRRSTRSTRALTARRR